MRSATIIAPAGTLPQLLAWIAAMPQGVPTAGLIWIMNSVSVRLLTKPFTLVEWQRALDAAVTR